jgi:hypothetical protein
MSKEKTTLADVQPGGRVRLGDGPFVWSDRAKADALEAGQYAFTEADGKDLGYTACIEACVDAICLVLEMPEHRLALSAQPSPGGQDAQRIVVRVPGVGQCTLTVNDGAVEIPAQTIAALAARQPVGEPVVVAHRYIQRYQSAEHSAWLSGDADETYVEAERQGLGRIERAYAAPPAQAVDHRAALLAEERAHGETIDQRDRYHEVADELAGHIAAITGVDIGEHSSANCPWQNAIEAAEEYKPAQAVDLGLERMFYIQDTRQFVGNCPVWWAPNGGGYVTRLDEAGRYSEQEAVKKNRTRDTDIPWPCAEIDAIARPTVDFQHMRPRAERLAELALIDSQVVGNG